MDARLFRHIQSKCPEMNPLITRGIAYHQLRHVEAYVDRIIRCAEPGFPQGLRYVGPQRCNPYEEYFTVTMKSTKANKMHYELLRSDVYLVKYIFEYTGPDGVTEELKPVYLYLPFVSEAGLITIRGSQFVISPVLADKAISVLEDSIFVPLNRDKLTFRRQTHCYMQDSQRVSVGVVWCNMYHEARKRPGSPVTSRTVNANAALAHYLFCKYGVTHAFKHLTGQNVDVVVGDSLNITRERFPESDWHICSSTQVKPVGYRGKFRMPTTVLLAIRRVDMNHLTSSLIAGFFYVADRFPERVLAEYVDDPTLWRALTGQIIFGDDMPAGQMLNKIDDHMVSLDAYVDGMVREWLAEDHVHVNDLYGLLVHIIETFSSRIAESGNSIASMYGKRLMVMRYVLLDVIKSVFKTLYALQNAAKKRITKDDINKRLQDNMKFRTIIRINNKHSEVASVSSPSSCMAFKITSNVVLQSSISNSGNGAKTLTIDSSKNLHASIAEAGQYNNLPKGEPTGRNRLNPFATLGEDWSILRNPELIPLLDSIQEDFQR